MLLTKLVLFVVTLSATQHSSYLEDFCRRMRTELQQMVDCVAQAQCECNELPAFIDEVYHHWMLVKRKSEGVGE